MSVTFLVMIKLTCRSLSADGLHSAATRDKTRRVETIRTKRDCQRGSSKARGTRRRAAFGVAVHIRSLAAVVAP